MSTVPRVNLLPPEILERQRAQRVNALAAGAVALYAVVLGGIYLVQLGDVNAARAERDEAEALVAQLRQDLVELQPFAELRDKRDARVELLRLALANEISWARVFNDLSLAFPSSASLLTLSATTSGIPQAGAAAATPAAVGDAVGTLTFTGYSVERYAPGVETVLLQLADVRTLFNIYLATAQDEPRGTTIVVNFDGSAQLRSDAFTGRFAEGLPPEVE